ncbi:hypothetical protein ACFWSF_15460 [Streptomyces sp. NPDC058611]|uniref:hypothetical protein n=1 Tax=unclassified Streptomyces TaxID=2593676 RepID=UPI003647A040
MHTHRRTARRGTTALLAATALLGLAACAPVTSEPQPDGQPVASTPATPPTPAPPTPAPPTPTPAAPTAQRTTPPPAAPAPPPAPATAAVPNFVGMVLQSAQDGAQAAGFFLMTSHDALGKNRLQVLDRNWRVCTQTPAAGTKTGTDTKLDFGTVKLEERCP